MRHSIVLAMALPLLAAASPPDRSVVAYSLTPEITGSALTALKVQVRFRGDASGTTEFGWPDRWAGNHELWR